MKVSKFEEMLENVVRRVVRQELMYLNEQINPVTTPRIVESNPIETRKPAQQKSMPTKAARPQQKPVITEQKQYTKNPALNEILNQTVGDIQYDDSDWPTMQFGSTAAVPMHTVGDVVIDDRPELESIKKAVTRDYSELMKAMDKKKGI